MSLNTWWLFVMMTFVVSATPGPNMLLVMSTGARQGLRGAVTSMAGCMTSLMLMLSLSAAGLGALLQAFPAVFDALRLAGAAYLAYLGVQVWRSPVQESNPSDGAAQGSNLGATLSSWALYRQGALVAASNPKAILFAAAFFPQFLNPALPQLPQFGILLGTFAVVEVSWYFVYAASGKQLARYLQRASVMRAFNRLTGGVFVGFAALMAGAKS
ncbi:LysE family translocator [Rhodoferax sp. TS-BS-61-7]|uniref:LysE family translocator n=1 Tax=Rhodoferax sp. TS-BS-61-7 TaxID=2094194 RepID=UPI000CF6C064|nr:LysE family translocator [Rhodoferax sp. TS-BS-61-7]PQA77989.1 amino acid transporter [Rhodoferax sp. TS-BS-61-7]